MTFYEIFIEGDGNKFEINGVENIIETTSILKGYFESIGSTQIATSFENLIVPGSIVKVILSSALGTGVLTRGDTQSEVHKCESLKSLIRDEVQYDLVMYEI